MLRNLFAKLLGLNWLGAGAWLLKNWQTCLVVAFALSVFHYCRARDAANVAKGQAEQRSADMAKLVVKYRKDASDAEESVAVLDNRLDAQHANYEQDLARLGVKLGRVDTLTLARWLHDTVTVAGPTVTIPTAAVLEADTLLHACTEYMNTCAQFRAYAAKRFAADSQTIVALQLPLTQPVSRRCGIQLTVGPTIERDRSTHYGVGGVLGVGCRW